MFGDYELSLHDYLSILRRHALVMTVVFGMVLTGSVIFAFVLPRVYESTATILVEGPQVQVPSAESASRVRPEDRVDLVQQRLMTRENLIRVADKHQLFSEAGVRGLSNTDAVEAMRRSIRVELRRATGDAWGPRPASTSFNLSFQNSSPEKALAVTQELVELFLTSNRRDRVDQASRTTEFLSGEAERVRKEMEPLEAKLAALKSQQGGGASPENVAAALGGLQSMEADLRGVERDQRLAQSELRALQVDLAAARRGVMTPGAVADLGQSPMEQELERARAQLAALRAVYTANHPDILSLVRRIQGLEQAVNSESRVQTPSRTAAREQAELAASRIEAQVEAARSRVDLLTSQQSSLRASIAQQRALTYRAPQLERQMAGLQRDYDAARAKYDELRNQLMSAQVVENLEGGLQAERFTLLEPPLLAEYPVKPSRKKIVAGGFVAALAAAVGIAVLLEMLLARVWGVSALTAAVKQRPLAVIPYIAIGAETQAFERWRKRSAYLVLGLGVLVLLVVHFWVTPLQTALIYVTSHLN